MIYLYRYALIVVYTVFWAGLACGASLFARSGAWAEWAARRWVRRILASCGVAVECKGVESLPRDGSYVFMSNHQSVFDVAAIIDTLPVPFRFVAKRELTWIPLFGWALRLGGHVIVDRDRRERSVRSLRSAAERVRRGMSVVIFPEGTRSDSGSLGPFKSGGFHLALEAGVPVIPISVSGSRRITPKRSLRIEQGRIRVRYGAPIPTQGRGLGERDALKREVRRAILAGFDPDFPEAPSPPRAVDAPPAPPTLQ